MNLHGDAGNNILCSPTDSPMVDIHPIQFYFAWASGGLRPVLLKIDIVLRHLYCWLPAICILPICHARTLCHATN